MKMPRIFRDRFDCRLDHRGHDVENKRFRVHCPSTHRTPDRRVNMLIWRKMFLYSKRNSVFHSIKWGQPKPLCINTIKIISFPDTCFLLHYFQCNGKSAIKLTCAGSESCTWKKTCSMRRRATLTINTTNIYLDHSMFLTSPKLPKNPKIHVVKTQPFLVVSFLAFAYS